MLEHWKSHLCCFFLTVNVLVSIFIITKLVFLRCSWYMFLHVCQFSSNILVAQAWLRIGYACCATVEYEWTLCNVVIHYDGFLFLDLPRGLINCGIHWNWNWLLSWFVVYIWMGWLNFKTTYSIHRNFSGQYYIGLLLRFVAQILWILINYFVHICFKLLACWSPFIGKYWPNCLEQVVSNLLLN